MFFETMSLQPPDGSTEVFNFDKAPQLGPKARKKASGPARSETFSNDQRISNDFSGGKGLHSTAENNNSKKLRARNSLRFTLQSKESTKEKREVYYIIGNTGDATLTLPHIGPLVITAARAICVI